MMAVSTAHTIIGSSDTFPNVTIHSQIFHRSVHEPGLTLKTRTSFAVGHSVLELRYSTMWLPPCPQQFGLYRDQCRPPSEPFRWSRSRYELLRHAAAGGSQQCSLPEPIVLDGETFTTASEAIVLFGRREVGARGGVGGV